MRAESDLRVTNFAHLLVETLKRHRAAPHAPFTTMEAVVIGFMSAEEDGDRSNVGDRVAHEIDDLRMPKWVALITWLSPSGLCADHPRLAGRMARYLLGYTRAREESRLPLGLKREFGL
jgi:hypothetical protein